MVNIWLESIVSKSVILDIINNPLVLKSMVWAMFPMILTLILMEFYFSHHPSEELGWNTAFGNSLMIMFVSLGLFGRIVEQGYLYLNFSTIMAGLLLFFGIFLTVIDFFKLIPKHLAFGISSALTVNLFGVISILAVYTKMQFNLANFLVIFAIIISMIVIIKLIELFYSKNYFETKEDEEQNNYYRSLCAEYMKKGNTFPQIRNSFRQSGLKDTRITYLFKSVLKNVYINNKRSYQDYLFPRFGY